MANKNLKSLLFWKFTYPSRETSSTECTSYKALNPDGLSGQYMSRDSQGGEKWRVKADNNMLHTIANKPGV